ncbi:MAG TPA: hypothetical protein VH413_17845 [Verrucomicrobiae bacterium]|jgi:hypothetical protein|nr:hypothetical protein [Verrucomicrobiae bacterium]
MISPATETPGGALSNSLREESPYDPQRFDWPLAFDAEKFLHERISAFLERNSFARELALRMREETGTDFFEWIDHLVLSPGDEKALCEVGFVLDTEAEAPKTDTVLHHPRATLPRVILRAGHVQNPSVIALRPEFVADFAAKNNLAHEIEGASFSHYRRMLVHQENGTRLEAVERHAYRGFVIAPLRASELEAIVKARELWHTRKRIFANDAEGFVLANDILNQSIPLVGRDLSCDFFFASERTYWEGRNRAARIQKFRQDQLGLGWGNHDHHTFRSSREHFVDLIDFLVKLGFEKRERYYAGSEAGWGAQISEQPTVGIVVFADVDLMPDETQIDFSSKRLPPAPKLGTVGLWVGLHGESFLGAGMHHLEARFDYQLLRDQLKAQGINTMNPFSNFEFLRQAFTEGERWAVARSRAERLLAAKLITGEQFEKFMKEGALGSHLENLQRHGGFKGFNQKSVSVVISATDPRKSHFQTASA